MRIISIVLILMSLGILYILFIDYLNISIDEKYDVEITYFTYVKTHLKMLIAYTLIVIFYIIYNLIRHSRKSKIIK